LFVGERMTCKDSDELDTSSDSDSTISSIPSIQRILQSEPPKKSAKIQPGKSETKKKDGAKPKVKNHKFDLENPPL
jgi:hypothetical protein